MHIQFCERKQRLHSCPFLPKGTLRGRGMILLRVWVWSLPQVCLLECDYVCMVVFVCTVCATLSYVFLVLVVWIWKEESPAARKGLSLSYLNTINDMEILQEAISNSIYGIHIKKGPGIQIFSFYEEYLYIHYNVT